MPRNPDKIYLRFVEPTHDNTGKMVTEVEVGNPTWQFWDDLGDWASGVERWRFVYREDHPELGRFLPPPSRMNSYPLRDWQEIKVPARLPDVPPYNHLTDCQKGMTP